ncbi:hypothetical protein ACCT11_35880, partial [Rhizobium johnstonii]
GIMFGEVNAVSCLGATNIPRRIDEQGKPYDCDTDVAAYATFELEGGAIAQVNSSWAVRVRVAVIGHALIVDAALNMRSTEAGYGYDFT